MKAIKFEELLKKFQSEQTLSPHEVGLIFGFACGSKAKIIELENEIHSLKAIIASHEWKGKYPSNKSGVEE